MPPLTKASAIGIVALVSGLTAATCGDKYLANNGIADPIQTVVYSPIGYGCGCYPGMVHPSSLGGLGLLVAGGAAAGLLINALTNNFYQRPRRNTRR